MSEELFQAVAKKRAKFVVGVERDAEGQPSPVLKSGQPRRGLKKWKAVVTERDDNGFIKELVFEAEES